MPDLTPFSEVGYLFREFQHTAWRLETQRGYAVDRGTEKWNRWRSGATFDYEPDAPWHQLVRAALKDGRRFERVRLVDDPPTDGQRYLLDSGLGNVAAGEDIRNMWRTDAEELGLPAYDFWLFDSRLVARFAFDEQEVTLGVYLSEDPAEVVRACQVRDAAWHHAILTERFRSRVPAAT